MSRWKSTPFNLIDNLPASPGVYVLFYRGEPVYVGQSTDMLARLRAHRRAARGAIGIGLEQLYGCDPDDLLVKYKPSAKFAEWIYAELRLISRLSPWMNKYPPDWREVHATMKDQPSGSRQRRPGNVCAKCGRSKKPRQMTSKTWCKECRSFAPAEWRATGERDLRYAKETSRSFSPLVKSFA